MRATIDGKPVWFAATDPVWDWCDRCMSFTVVHYKIVSLSPAGVTVHCEKSGCVNEWKQRERARNGL